MFDTRDDFKLADIARVRSLAFELLPEKNQDGHAVKAITNKDAAFLMEAVMERMETLGFNPRTPLINGGVVPAVAGGRGGSTIIDNIRDEIEILIWTSGDGDGRLERRLFNYAGIAASRSAVDGIVKTAAESEFWRGIYDNDRAKVKIPNDRYGVIGQDVLAPPLPFPADWVRDIYYAVKATDGVWKAYADTSYDGTMQELVETVEQDYDPDRGEWGPERRTQSTFDTDAIMYTEQYTATAAKRKRITIRTLSPEGTYTYRVPCVNAGLVRNGLFVMKAIRTKTANQETTANDLQFHVFEKEPSEVDPDGEWVEFEIEATELSGMGWGLDRQIPPGDNTDVFWQAYQYPIEVALHYAFRTGLADVPFDHVPEDDPTWP